MGVNQSRISNRTGHSLHILTFNNSELCYWHYRHMRQPPADQGEITVDGLAGGGAVKVGVIFNVIGGRYVFDLFRVSHGATLTIRTITKESGVTEYDRVEGMERIARGMTIRVSADQQEAVIQGIQMAGNVAGIAIPVGNVGRLVANAIPRR